MKKLFASLMAMLCGFVGCKAQNMPYESVDVEDFVLAVAKPEVVVLDVRTAQEYAAGHLPYAINIDVNQNTFEQKALKTLPKDYTIALYCRSGRRSKKAAEILAKQGYRVVELSTGFIGWEQARKPVTKEEVDLFFTPKGTRIYLFSIKHGSVKMRIGDRWIYVDPVTEATPPPTNYADMPKADFILVTHSHYDHLDAVAVEQLRKEETVVVANGESASKLTAKTQVMKNGQSLKLAGGNEVKAVPAYNTSEEKQQFHPKGRDNGYVLTVEGFSIYVAGDTEDIPELTKLKHIDVAFLPCNLPYTMTPQQLLNAAKAFSPKVLFPYHYGNTDMKEVVTLFNDTKIDVRIRQYQ